MSIQNIKIAEYSRGFNMWALSLTLKHKKLESDSRKLEKREKEINIMLETNHPDYEIKIHELNLDCAKWKYDFDNYSKELTKFNTMKFTLLGI
jgi:hypothetical protein